MYQYRDGAQIKTCDGCYGPLPADGIESPQLVREDTPSESLVIRHFCDDACFERWSHRTAGVTAPAPMP